MSEVPAPPTKKDGGKGWSAFDGKNLSPDTINSDIQLDPGDIARFLPAETRQKVLAMKALDIAFERTHPELAAEPAAMQGFSHAVLTASANNLSPEVEYFKQEYQIAQEHGLSPVPLTNALEQLKAVGVLDESAYWQAMAIVARLYSKENPPLPEDE